MNVLIELTQVDARATREAQIAFQRAQYATQGATVVDAYSDTDEPGENGASEEPEAPAEQPQAPGEVTRPVLVNPASVRSVTERRDGVGSRLTFSDGGGYPVIETYEEIKELFASAGVQVVTRPSQPAALIAQS